MSVAGNARINYGRNDTVSARAKWNIFLNIIYFFYAFWMSCSLPLLGSKHDLSQNRFILDEITSAPVNPTSAPAALSDGSRTP